MAKSPKKHRRSSDIPVEKEEELREIARARLGLGDQQGEANAPAPTGDGHRSGRPPAPADDR